MPRLSLDFLRILKNVYFLFGKIVFLSFSRFKLVYSKISSHEITDKELIRKINSEQMRQAFHDNKIGEFLRAKAKPRFLTSLPSTFFHNISSGIKEKIISSADQICDHYFDLLGSGTVNLNKNINWHCDFKTGYEWPRDKYYRDINIPYGKADIKVPWELSRFEHLSTLGQAYQITKNEKYSKEFVSQISDWIDKNKPAHGVNWKCTMDVAIRACNWIVAFNCIIPSDSITDAFVIKLLKSFYQHGVHIFNNLERGLFSTSNHYLSDIVGLIFLGIMFPELKVASKWKTFAIKQLVLEMRNQVLDDGCDFEESTCYHRLVLELFFFATLLAVQDHGDFNGSNAQEVIRQIFGDKYASKLYKMFDTICYILKPNGFMPQIGDNDSGQLFRLYPRKVLDMRYLLALGAVFFKESKWKVREYFDSDDDIAEVLLTYGESGRKTWDSLKWNSLKNIGSKRFINAGWYIMRKKNNYCAISCGPRNQYGRGAHAHNDRLSFELCVNGKDIIVDPGTYVYTPDPVRRDSFRGTAFHNTVMIDSKEQNKFIENSVFVLKDKSRGTCLEWEISEDADLFIGRHYGYTQSRHPIIHTRKIKFLKASGEVEITDEFEGKGRHKLQFNFIISPTLTSGIIIRSDSLKWNTLKTHYSPEYGVIVDTVKYSADIEIEDNAKIKSFIKIK